MKTLLKYDFEFVENLSPVLDRAGKIKEFYPQSGYKNEKGISLNKYGSGAFCRFSIDVKWSGISGVYAIFIEDELVYIGQCLDFAQRFNQGYGNISATSCYRNGQSTNCKINKVVLESAQANKTISLFFYKTGNYNLIEEQLIKHYNPIYNTMLKESSPKIKESISPESHKKITNPSTEEVRNFIRTILFEAKEKGLTDCIISSGDIHRKLSMKNAMPTVCTSMRTLGSSYRYEVLEQPPKGNGSRLTFKYIF